MRELPAPQRQRDLSQRSQVSRAAREIVRWIHTHKLKLDDRLPPQSDLVRELAFSNDTISEAMRALVDASVLTRRRRVGTVVLDPDRPVRGLWRVGVAVFSAIYEPFYAQLLHRVLLHLEELGCVSTLHMLAPGCTRRPPNLSDFGALAEDIEESVLSGVISFSDMAMLDWCRVEERGVPMCYVGSWEDASCGVVIDQAPMSQRAVTLLASQGCKQLMLVHTGNGEAGYNRGLLSYEAAVKDAELGEPSQRTIAGGQGPHGGARVANALLALPEHERPDGLVVLNDWVGMGLTARFAEAGSYRPKVVVQTNKQAPLAFAFPVIHFEVDVEQMALRSVAMLLQRMRDPSFSAQREWISPQRSSGEPSQIISEEVVV